MMSASAQTFDSREKAAEILKKIENFERREQIEELMEKLDVNDVKSDRQKSTLFEERAQTRGTRGTRNSSSVTPELVADLLKTFSDRDFVDDDEMHTMNSKKNVRDDVFETSKSFTRRGDRTERIIQVLLEILMNNRGSDRYGEGESRNFDVVRDLIEMLAGQGRNSGNSGRREEMQRTLVEVLLRMLTQGRNDNRQFGGQRRSQDLNRIIRELIGDRRSRGSTDDFDDLFSGDRNRRGNRSKKLERFLDVIESAESTHSELDRLLYRLMLESVTDDRMDIDSRRGDDEQDEVVNLLMKRIMMHLMNDVEACRLELEVMSQLLASQGRRRGGNDNYRRGRGRRSSGLMNTIQEHLRNSFDGPTTRRMEDHDIIRAILRLQYSDNAATSDDDMDAKIIRLLRNYCEQNEHKVRGNRSFSLNDFIRELTSNSTTNGQGYGRGGIEEVDGQGYGRGGIAELVREIFQGQGRRGNNRSDRETGSRFDDFHRGGDRYNSFDRGDGPEKVFRSFFDRDDGFSSRKRSDGLRRDGLYERRF